MLPVREAFLASYGPQAVGNRFTKVKMDARADIVLRNYFSANAQKIEAWFNIITPKRRTLETLKSELAVLNAKDWQRILSA